VIAAVVFDNDGVLVDSERVWDDARRSLVAEHGRPWPDGATRAMLGMSSPEWTAYVSERLLGGALAPEEVNRRVVERMLDVYRGELPLLPGAVAAVRRLAARWPLGLASSSNPEVIEAVLAGAGIADCFAAWVSSEQVGAGKPAPDVYLEAARRLGADPAACAAIEDSHNGILSARAAGMAVVALPNEHFPPAAEALAQATAVIGSLDALTPELIASLA